MKIQDSRFKIQTTHRAWVFYFLCSVFCILLSACATPVASSASPDPTEFVQTRVAEILTENPPPIIDAPTLPAATPIPTLEVTVAPADTARPLPTAGATITPPSTPQATHTPATPCALNDATCTQTAEHFWLARPIPTTANFLVERTYPYGATQNGAREPHHGVEFENRSGTPALAVAAGTVVFAGNDSEIAFGPSLAFYGNVVIVELNERYLGEPVFTLYGHLRQVNVTTGQRVTSGDLLGEVGLTGVAIGPHLHFEVRVGHNDYASTRNPELWLIPLLHKDKFLGAIAGRVVDLDGQLIPELTVVIRPIKIDYPSQRNRFITTYANVGLNGDNLLQENFATGDLPLGTYTVSVNTTKPYQQTITVEAGRITFVTFVVKPPYPTPTRAP